MMPKVTIVVLSPQGDEEKLKRTLNSISQQTYDEVETLVIAPHAVTLPAFVEQAFFGTPADLAHGITLAQQHAKGEFITFMQAPDFIMDEADLSQCMDEVDQRDVELGLANFTTLEGDQFYFNTYLRGKYGLINANNIIPYMRFHRGFRGIWGLFLRRELLMRLTPQNSGQRVLYQAVHQAKKALLLESRFYCLVVEGSHQVAPFEWQADYEYSDAHRLVQEIQASGYQEQIPAQINVALCIDDNLIRRLPPLIYSIAKHNQDLNLYLVYYRLTAASRAALLQLADYFPQLHFKLRRVSKELHQLIEPIDLSKAKLPVATYHRVLLPHILPDVSRVIYLDTDTQVMASLQSLWQTKLAGNFLGATGDIAPYLSPAENPNWPHPMFGNQGENYFNSGVLLMDLDLMRQYHVAFKVIKTALDTAQLFVQADQDAHNLYYFNAYHRLDIKYNYGTPVFDYDVRSFDDIVILHHYVNKPWQPEVMVNDNPLVLAALNGYYRDKREADELLGKWPAKVSVVIDLRHPAHFNLGRCLSSLLYQSYTALEFIVLTNGELPATQAQYLAGLAKYHPFKFERSGQLAAAVAQASGQYLYFVDIDDLLLHETVIEQFMQAAQQGARLVVSDHQWMNRQTNMIYWQNKPAKVEFFQTVKPDAYQREFGQLAGCLVAADLAKASLASGVVETDLPGLWKQTAGKVAILVAQLWLMTVDPASEGDA